MRLHVGDGIDLLRQRIVDVDHDDLPVRLPLVQDRQAAEEFDPFDLAGRGDVGAEFADVEGVVVASFLGVGVDEGWVFPCL